MDQKTTYYQSPPVNYGGGHQGSIFFFLSFPLPTNSDHQNHTQKERLIIGAKMGVSLTNTPLDYPIKKLNFRETLVITKIHHPILQTNNNQVQDITQTTHKDIHHPQQKKILILILQIEVHCLFLKIFVDSLN